MMMMRSFSVLLVLAVMIFLIQVIPPSVSVIPDESKCLIKKHDEHHVALCWDWRAHGAVTRVKHQGDCEACWVFSVVAAIEGAVQIAINKMAPAIPLSEQEIIDCDYMGTGCKCGNTVEAFRYATFPGLVSEYLYPYQGFHDTCKTNAFTHHSRTRIKGLRFVLPPTERSLQEAVATVGPISAAVMTTQAWIEYRGRSDILLAKHACHPDDPIVLNHAVTVVGYGTDSITGLNYWIIKNSWGEDWGHGGYMYLQKDIVGVDGGACGIAQYATYPTLLNEE